MVSFINFFFFIFFSFKVFSVIDLSTFIIQLQDLQLFNSTWIDVSSVFVFLGLHCTKKSFPLKISSVNVTKSAGN